jgi:hypothetical protein
MFLSYWTGQVGRRLVIFNRLRREQDREDVLE